MITKPQNRFYWGLWGKAKAELMNGRETWTQAEENNRRHELHVRALGRDKSHRDFTNRELDYVLAQFRMVVDPFGSAKSKTSPHARAMTADESYRRRLYFGLRGTMRKFRVGEEYVNAISRRMFVGLEIGDLAVDELQKLIIALKQHERRHPS